MALEQIDEQQYQYYYSIDESNGHHENGTGTELSAEERESLHDDLRKTEDEIGTLRQVLSARIKHANELKHKLGLTPWSEIAHDITHGLQTVKESTAYQRTSETVNSGAQTMKQKMEALRNSTAYKSFETKLGSAYGNVKSKLAGSTSMYTGFGADTSDGVAEGNVAGAQTQPTTPGTEKKETGLK